MSDLQVKIASHFASWITQSTIAFGELTLEVKPDHIRELCLALRDNPEFDFKLCIDICGVDYLHYGVSEWETDSTTTTGFSRGVEIDLTYLSFQPKDRFAVVYHLLSIQHNHRIRLRVMLPEMQPMIESVIGIWPAANWYEREAYDLFGIIFKGHPDLRRLLTDYGFQGHPFRKDFPLIGKLEVRYDAKQKRVIYEPVSIKPRVLEPKVIRSDNRYLNGQSK